MTSDPTIERRITRLEKDRDSLYELLDSFRTEVDARFDQVQEHLDRVDTRLDGLSAGLVEVLRRLPEPR